MDHAKLERFLTKKGFSGNILVTSGNEPLFEGSYGLAHRGFGVPNTQTTRFALASVAKLFTGVSILQLVASGQCSLDDPISDYFTPEDLPTIQKVTVSDLLTHSSGLPDYIDEADPDTFTKLYQSTPNASLTTTDSYLRLIRENAYPTGAKGKFCYNNYGYILLGKLVEELTQTSFYQHVEEKIFKPADMDQTGYFQLDWVIKGMAEGYDHGKSGQWQKNIFSIPNRGAADGGAYSTTTDLVKFVKAVKNNTLLPDRYTSLFVEPKIFDYQEEDLVWYYGLGNWLVSSKETKELIRWGHPGEDVGVSTRLFHYLKNDTTVVILSNVTNQAGKVAWRIHDEITD